MMENQLIKKINPELLQLIPAETALAYKVLPVSKTNGSLCLATGDNANSELAYQLAFVLNRKIELQKWPVSMINDALRYFYKAGQQKQTESNNAEYKILKESAPIKKPKENGNGQTEISVINKVNSIVTNAINQRASDIHFEPFEHFLRVRFRIDGALQNREELATGIKNEIISRIKIMADLDNRRKAAAAGWPDSGLEWRQAYRHPRLNHSDGFWRKSRDAHS